ncbi:MAG: CBS domain-containing protein [Desulfosarcinaceae bacterium]|nr:CBS domain-containing protein [Desulfosarcinaceae bacterium]
MKTVSIKALMVPLSEYATVPETATLAEAIAALDKAQQNLCRTKYRHRAILVLDQDQQPIGMISQIDALRALEPKYKEIQGQDTRGVYRHFSRMFLNSMIEYHRLFDGTLEDMRKKAANILVRDFMHTLSAEDCVSEEATLDQAIHLLIMGHHQSLLVSRAEKIVGILRLSDVFSAVFQPLAASDTGS